LTDGLRRFGQRKWRPWIAIGPAALVRGAVLPRAWQRGTQRFYGLVAVGRLEGKGTQDRAFGGAAQLSIELTG
jgi:hypothetical protein